MKEKIIQISKYFLTYIIVIIFFLLSLFLTSIIPSSIMKEHVKESATILEEEGNYKECFIINRLSVMRFDNYTDSLMVNSAYSIDSENPFESSMLVRKNYVRGVTKNIYKDSNGELVSASKYEKYEPIKELKDTVNDDIEESFEYARYWHGYLIFLRPLLLIFNISQIRIFNTIVLIVLAIVLLFLIAKKIDIKTMIFFLIGLISVEYFYIGMSLQGMGVFVITIIASIIILLKGDKFKNIGLLFFMIGMITNFIDFLTQPILTLFIPLIIYFLIKQKNQLLNKETITIKEILKTIIGLSLVWGLGYLLTWFGKWILVDLIFHREIIINAIIQTLYRTGNVFNFYISIQRNVLYELGILEILIVVFVTDVFIKFIKYGKEVKWNVKEMVPYIIIGFIPFIWYGVICNHSYEHYFFTYRILLITIICIPIIMTKVKRIKDK